MFNVNIHPIKTIIPLQIGLEISLFSKMSILSFALYEWCLKIKYKQLQIQHVYYDRRLNKLPVTTTISSKNMASIG